jgi:hypothetical protein
MVARAVFAVLTGAAWYERIIATANKNPPWIWQYEPAGIDLARPGPLKPPEIS